MAGKEWENHCQTLTSCALAGAASFFAGIPDAYIIANGPAWCYFYALRKVEQPNQGLEKRFFSTYPDNKSVIFGTENKLLATLDLIKKMPQQPSVLLIENSCAISLIGDDIAGIAAGTQPAFPVVTFDSGGLVGGHWEGYRKAAKAYFEEIPLEQDCETEQLTVNILGSDASYFGESYDVKEIRRLLGLIGVSVHAVVGNGATVEEMRNLKKAALNIVLHRECGEDLAVYLFERYGMKYLSINPPYGVSGTRAWLRQVGECLGVKEENFNRVERELSETENYLYLYTRDAQKVWGEPWFDTVILSGPSSIVEGMSGVMRKEWLDTAQVYVFTHDEWNAEGKEKIGKNLFLHGEELQALLRNERGLILASGHERKLVNETNRSAWEFITIANPDPMALILTDRPLMGIKGTRAMMEMIWSAYIHVRIEGDKIL